MEEHNFSMIHDGMNAIKKCELDEYIKNFNGDTIIWNENLGKITEAMENSGQLHSGSSFSFTIRHCSYFLKNKKEWDQLCEKYLK